MSLIALYELFAIGKGFGGDADLHDPRLVHPSDTHIFEDPVIDFTLATVLDNNFLVAAEQGPKRRCLGGTGGG